MKVNILNFDQYEREAVLAPSVICCLIVFYAIYSYIPYQRVIELMSDSLLLSSSILLIILFSIFILIINIVRMISRKFVEQFIYGSNHENIPTTEYLLHTSSFGNPVIADKVRAKIKEDFNISLKSKTSEEKDQIGAKKIIIASVALIRKKLQGSKNEMYDRKNRRYGMCRNFIGSFYVSSLISILAFVFGLVTSQSILCPIISLGVSILSICILFLFYKDVAKDYANELFVSYLNL